MFGYDNADLESTSFQGEVDTDWYGRPTPKGEHGSANLPRMTNSRTLIRNAALAIYDRLMKPFLHLRRVYLVALNTVPKEKGEAINADSVTQLSLFEEPPADKGAEEKAALQEEEDLQKAILAIQERYGKNSVLKAMNLEEGGTTVERNKQIGGHKA